MIGTAEKPIIWQPAGQNATPWGQLRFSDSKLTVRHLLVTGGGNPESQNQFEGQEANLVIATDTILDMEQSTISNSASSGLLFLFNTIISNFGNNTFSGNKEAGLVLQDADDAVNLDSGSDYVGKNNPNGLPAISLGNRVSETLVLENIGAPYHFDGLSASGLLIRAGVEMWFSEGTGLRVRDSFYLRGTESNPVVIKGTPEAGNSWAGMALGGRVIRMSKFVIEGGAIGPGSEGAALTFTSSFSDAVVTDGAITDSQGWAVLCTSQISSTNGNLYLENINTNNSLAGDFHPDCEAHFEKAIEPGDAVELGNPTQVTDPLLDCAEVLFGKKVGSPFVFRNSDSSCDYYMLGESFYTGNIVIEPGTTFIMADGSRIEFENISVTANGTIEQPISFIGESEHRGAWRGIGITGSTGNVFNEVAIHHGGNWEFPSLGLGRASIALTNTRVGGSDSSGIDIPERSTVDEFRDNVFFGNTLTGLKIDYSHVNSLDSASTYNLQTNPNGNPGIEAYGFAAGKNGSEIFPSYGAPWYFGKSISITARLRNNITSFDAGNRLVFAEGASMLVSTPVRFDGTAESPILVSGHPDDPNQWGTIQAYNSGIDLSNVRITGGGAPQASTYSEDEAGDSATVMLVGVSSSAKLSNVTISEGLQWGISCSFTGTLRPADFLLENVSFENNAKGTISSECNL